MEWLISRLLLVGIVRTISQIEGNEIRNISYNKLHVRICFSLRVTIKRDLKMSNGAAIFKNGRHSGPKGDFNGVPFWNYQLWPHIQYTIIHACQLAPSYHDLQYLHGKWILPLLLYIKVSVKSVTLDNTLYITWPTSGAYNS